MNQDKIIEQLKKHYPRDIRKQLIKSLLENEKSKDHLRIEEQHKIIKQIFTYVLQESNWRMGENSENWDNRPLEIMNQVFPKINQTQWYKDQNISTKSTLDIKIGVENK